MKRKKIMASGIGLAMLYAAGFAGTANASFMTGGDAADQASADDILDIVFAIDTSGSMYDDINAIGAAAQGVIENLECPDCDIWVRASFMGIKGKYGSVFNESVYDYVTTLGQTPTVNHSEDNGPAVVDLVNWYNWNDDSTASQDYYKAVVTIGDEGTDNGYPVNQDDWNAAYAANQAAIANNVFLFSWVTDDPYTGVVDLFETMAMGGTGGGYTFGFAGGGFVNDSAGTGDVGETLERIICTAGSGGGNEVPEPATMLLFGTGIAGLVASRRKRKDV